MVVQALKFIHEKGYTHNDVKAQNLLVGLEKDNRDKVYLVDFGLACKYRDAFGFHALEEPDERKAHDGTLEYTSRDAHTGAHSRRGDLETLGYNMVHWAAGTLPWLTELEDPEQVKFLLQNSQFMFLLGGIKQEGLHGKHYWLSF